MFEYTCPICGETKQARYKWEIKTYCSRECANKALSERFAKKREENFITACVFQPESIECNRRNCINCGWNPVVAKARLAAIKGKAIPDPKPKEEEPKPIREKHHASDQWIPVTERLPEIGETVLACGQRDGVYMAYIKNAELEWHKPYHKNHYCKPTYWMPMPEAPKEVDHES